MVRRCSTCEEQRLFSYQISNLSYFLEGSVQFFCTENEENHQYFNDLLCALNTVQFHKDYVGIDKNNMFNQVE